jgi:hypothetical protein
VLRIDSQALGTVSKALGISGRGALTSELEDASVVQVLDVGPLVRRGRTQGAGDGIYTAIIRNIHAGAGTIFTVVDPFDVTTGRRAPYPGPMPTSYDIWLETAALTFVSGSGTVTAALFTGGAGEAQGWGIDSAGAAVVTTPAFPLAFWDALIDETVVFGVQAGSEEPLARLGIRIRRGMNISFSTTASALATYDLELTLGVFPTGLGQDVLS